MTVAGVSSVAGTFPSDACAWNPGHQWQNIPAVEVMNRAGHKKFETTMKYYVNRSEESRKQLLKALNNISTEEIFSG